MGKSPRFKPIDYSCGDIKILITAPQPWGIATIYDMDIMMWFGSRIINKLNRNEKTSPVVEFTPYDCLKSIGRGTGGKDYKRFEAALNRLFRTHIVTTIRNEHQYLLDGIEYTRTTKEVEGFHWLEKFILTTERTKSGKEVIRGAMVVLSNWFYLGLLKKGAVLQLAHNYFELNRGLDRALYLIARKHCGRKPSWPIDMQALYRKTGSDSPYRNFITQIKKSVERNILPEYAMTLNIHKREMIIVFHYRPALNEKNKLWESAKYKGK